MDTLVFETLRAACSVASLLELTSVFKSTLNELGFPHYAAVEVAFRPQARAMTVLFGEPDVAWQEFYVQEALGSTDPRLRHMLGSAEPAFLSELVPLGSDPASTHFVSLFRAHGHGDCYVWPVHLPEGRTRAVLMLSDLHDVRPDARVAVGALAVAFHTAGSRILRQATARKHGCVELKPRQLECLYWARQGKSSADIGHILGISARTVDEHIGHACEALGVRTRVQAVARAVLLALF